MAAAILINDASSDTLRHILSFIIEELNSNQFFGYMRTCKSFSVAIKEIVRFHANRVRNNPLINELYSELLEMNLMGDLVLARHISMNRAGVSQLDHMTEFIHSSIFSKSTFQASLAALKVIVMERRDKYISLYSEAGLSYYKVLAPMIIELVARKFYNFAVLAVGSRFFHDPRFLFAHFTYVVPFWMRHLKVPKSRAERERIIRLILWSEIKINAMIILIGTGIASLTLVKDFLEGKLTRSMAFLAYLVFGGSLIVSMSIIVHEFRFKKDE